MSAPVLVLNCGSSSVKWAVVDPGSGETLSSGLAERLGSPRRASVPVPDLATGSTRTLLSLSPEDCGGAGDLRSCRTWS